MTWNRYRWLSAGAVGAVACCAAAAGASGYHQTQKYKVPGEGTWDYIVLDSNARRVYITHLKSVEVLDADSGAVVGKINGVNGSHGVAIASELNRGFATAGLADEVVIFDTKTLKNIGTAKTGKKPDSIMYEPTTKRVFAYNGDGESATVIEAATGKVVGTIPMGGGPEFSVHDGHGKIFVNIEDKSETVQIDAKSMKIERRIKLAPCEEPSALAIDRANGKLFAGCANKKLAVTDIATGKVMTTFPIGPHVDALTFDPETKLIFASTYDGKITVVHQDAADKYSLIDTLTTKQASKTMDVDMKTHKLWVPAASFQPPLPKDAIKTPPGAMPAAGTFEVLVFSK